MRIRYNRKENILTLELAEASIDHAEESGPIIAHFGEDYWLVLLEVLEASDFLAKLTKAAVRAEGEQAVEMQQRREDCGDEPTRLDVMARDAGLSFRGRTKILPHQGNNGLRSCHCHCPLFLGVGFKRHGGRCEGIRVARGDVVLI
jgi:hypothetical protein